MKTKAISNENKKRIDEIVNQPVEITIDGIAFTCRKKSLLYILGINKAPLKITQALTGISKGESSETEIMEAMTGLYDTIREIVIDPAGQDLDDLLDAWDTKHVMDLFNTYCYGANTGKVAVNKKEIEEVIEQAKNS
jgi:hypothetical protein